ncbi:MAG TPA: hypothetical protein VHM01_01990 [Alphaproteobacteria bacterium]|nr:hypothetical protein [Alphaproteobacteria bacterium]
MNGREKKAVLAARRSYECALAAGAAEDIAIDIACAAYRVAHPAMSDLLLRRTVRTEIVRAADPQPHAQLAGSSPLAKSSDESVHPKSH